MSAAYLTIDDSPSIHTLSLCDFLEQQSVPAIFYCRGDNIDALPDVLPAMIKRGFVIGNHGYAHKRAIDMSFAEITADIIKCEKLIDDAYAAAKVVRSGKCFRFPYLDRGCGSWIVDFQEMDISSQRIVQNLFAEGLYLDGAEPTEDLLTKKDQLQSWLKEQGFSVPFSGVNFPWYQHPQMLDARDALYTFSTADWMMTKRHQTLDHRFKTVDDLKRKIDSDPYLWDESSHNIVLIHDQAELKDVFISLVSYMREQGIKFLPIA
jgi:peptidoglycan/xylan/chitin deacetylase (PgdA/CDA1 family)